ncbi:MAG TPA: MBL fold metallo-hydrolase [Saprospiraceae bacterium]|nr:MBL fold metallo-hydrolase [Saprospiraceae bacterium]
MSLQVHSITFNPFEENTYFIIAPNNECIIIDPGCFDEKERKRLMDFISDNQLKPVRLINTHCHIDHILGNAFVAEQYNLGLEIHEGEIPVLQAGMTIAGMYGIPYTPSPDPVTFLKEHDEVVLDGSKLKVLFTPGHSPASICLYNEVDKWVIGGDVLFLESIGRTDLPGGDFNILINSIRTQLFTLPDDVVVYPGHGPETKIGYERLFNPFLQ